ncbi:hypothetical protein ACWDA3_59330 [Nonomuraea rubra]
MDPSRHPDWCDPAHCTAGFTFGADGAKRPIGRHHSARLLLPEGFCDTGNRPTPSLPIMWLSHTLNPETGVVLNIGSPDTGTAVFSMPLGSSPHHPSQILAAVLAGHLGAFTSAPANAFGVASATPPAAGAPDLNPEDA